MTRRTIGGRSLYGALIASALSLALAPSALGATLDADAAAGELRYTAGANRSNDVDFSRDGDDIIVQEFRATDTSPDTNATDEDPITATADSGCVQDPDGNAFRYRCTGAYTSTRMDMLDLNDDAQNFVALPTLINGGTGNDNLEFLPAGADGAPGTLNGEDGEDRIDSGEGAQTLNGGPGRDFMDPGDGDDIVNGGADDDYINDRRGDARLDGDLDPNGNDRLNGEDGDDTVCDGEGNETISGGAGNDFLGSPAGLDNGRGCGEGSRTARTRGTNVIDGGADDDAIFGGRDADSMTGGDGDDDLYGSPGDDRADGGAGDDSFFDTNRFFFDAAGTGSEFNNGDEGNDTYIGGPGRDFLDYEDRDIDENGEDDDMRFTADGLANDGSPGESDNAGADIEDLETGSGDDTVVMGDVANVVDTNSGDDSIDGRGGDDTLEGGEDRDTVNGGAGNDDLFGDEEDDCCEGAPDVLDGGAGNDNLFGQEGNDTLRGGDDNDALYGGVGSDDISGGGGSDFVDFTGSQARVNVSLDDVANDGFTGEGDNVRSDVEDVIGSEANDDITGSTLPNTLSGGEGNDTIRSRDLVSDIVICGPGVDTALVDDLDIVDTEGEDRCERIEVVATPKPTVQGPTQTQTQTVPGPTVVTPPVVTNAPRVAPRGLTALVTPARDRKFPYRFTTRGTLSLPAGMSPAQGCKGVITVQIKRGKKTISTRRVDVKPNCTYSVAATFAVKSRVPRRGTLRIRARFNGNNVLLPARAKEVRVRYGR